MALWVNRTVLSGASIAPNGTTSHTCTFTAATSGNLLVAVVAGPVTFTTPSGWTLVNSAVNFAGLYVFRKSASAGESSFTTTHNSSNPPIRGVVYEYASGSAAQNSGTSTGNSDNTSVSSPAVSSLTGTYTRFGTTALDISSGVTPGTTSWTVPTASDYDDNAPFSSQDGIQLGIGLDDGNSGASFTENANLSTGGGSPQTHERVAFALTVVTASTSAFLPFSPGKTLRRRRLVQRQLLSFPGTASGPQNYTQNLTASLSFVGAENEFTSKTLTGAALSFTGSETARTSRTLTGALSFAGSQTRLLGHLLTAALSFSGAQSRAVSKQLIAALSFSGALARAVAYHLTAALSFAGALTLKTVKAAFTAAVSFAGSFSAKIVLTRTLTAAVSFVGSQTRQTNKSLTGALSFAGAFTKQTAYHLTAAVSFVGSLVKKTSHTFTAALSFVGSQTATIVIKRTLTASVSFSGNLTTAVVHFFTKSLTGALSFTGAITKQTGKSLSGALSFSGSIPSRRIGHLLTGSLSFSGSLARRIGTHLASALSFAGIFSGFNTNQQGTPPYAVTGTTAATVTITGTTGPGGGVAARGSAYGGAIFGAPYFGWAGYQTPQGVTITGTTSPTVTVK